MNPIPLLRRAAAIASKISTKQEHRLAAVGIRSDGAIVRATNKTVRIATPRGGVAARLWTTHAEARLCRKLDAGAIVLVARVTQDGWAMARPCARCLYFLRTRRASVVFFTRAPGEYGVIDLALLSEKSYGASS